jgi:hypothetical protein
MYLVSVVIFIEKTTPPAAPLQRRGSLTEVFICQYFPNGFPSFGGVPNGRGGFLKDYLSIFPKLNG